MNKVAIYPGSFDPFTIGHQSIVEKSLKIFDKIIIAIGYNNKKNGYYDIEKRLGLIHKVYAGESRVEIIRYTGLTSDYCKLNNIKHIVRGLRNIRDFEFEREVAQINTSLYSELETIFLLTPAHTSIVSSSTVRELLDLGGDPMQFMPIELTLDDLQRDIRKTE